MKITDIVRNGSPLTTIKLKDYNKKDLGGRYKGGCSKKHIPVNVNNFTNNILNLESYKPGSPEGKYLMYSFYSKSPELSRVY